MVESVLKDRRHGDILDAFGRLENKKLIKRINELKEGRGRKQYYYKITQLGLELLVTDEPIHPLKFWKAILGYCHHYSGNISEGKFDELYLQFMSKYLKYPSHGFLSFQLEIFDNMCDKWFKDFILNNHDNNNNNINNKVSLAQRVIEVLAIYPKLNLDEIVEKTQASQSEINTVLSTYTLDSYRPLKDKTYYIHQNEIGKRYNKKYWDFLLHNVIISNQNGQGNIKTYELSLFGVILALTLVRYNDMDKLKDGLYYSNISLAEYYDKIVSNYKDKLPLIFGKWKVLKDVLRLYAAYNFDVIIDKEIRLRDYDKFSVIRGGNKELIDGIREIMLQTRQQIGRFIDSGEVIWLNYISGAQYGYDGPENQHGDYLIKNNIDVISSPNENPKTIYLVREKLDEIMMLLNPVERGFSESVSLLPGVIRELSHHLEELFADEITALYYFHLYYDFEFYTRVSEPMKYYSSSISSNNDNNQDSLHHLRPVSPSPKNCLVSILQSDKEKPSISEWLYLWMQDITNLQNEIYGYFKLQT
jgi:hypothetical protein